MKLFKRAATLSLLFFASFATVASAEPATHAPNFSFKDIEGRQHQFAEYRGKWVIVNYWATYCGPCVAELPALNSIARRYKDKVVVLGMEAGETPTADLKQFAAQRRISYPVVPTQDSTMFALGLIYGVPTTFIVNPQGQIVDTHMGAITVAQLQNYIRQDKRSSIAEEKDTCKTGVC
ncbi:MAG: TlpA family protein disulfide reductase [Gammaproteobacteria bacterium]|nr:TlpA family protein disulfide reductase [Gammaproteobacteria bacterium]MBU1722324.1 TlpA family protein disulfide reductase [Gammaproteobacteria bacterium]MBU2006441.1 TlpA family protein disulfide reductase [Gammaproteobacteria bacterium]